MVLKVHDLVVSTHSRPKAAAGRFLICHFLVRVSTHSRPKAAAACRFSAPYYSASFNTQPPEGGCPSPLSAKARSPLVSTHSRPKAAAKISACRLLADKFQHTAARRRLLGEFIKVDFSAKVSTHSRPKAAASIKADINNAVGVSTHSRPKAAALWGTVGDNSFKVSTHSRPKAAAGIYSLQAPHYPCFNTQPPEGGC